MKTKITIFALVLLLALLIAACSPKTAPVDSMEEKAMDTEVMEDDAMDEKESMEEDTMMKDKDPEAMSDEGDTMEHKDDEVMAEEDESMEHKDDEVMADKDEAMMDKSELTLNFDKLPALGDDWAYEGWLIVDDTPISSGIFTVSDDGTLSKSSFMVDAEALKMAAAFVLTIEPVPDSDPAPSPVHILAGDFADASAELTAGHAAALGNDFTSAGGTFILGIPTSDSDADSYTSGIWFTGLELPTLPDGWIYEGWVVGPDGPITTGTFSSPSTGDSDGGGPTAGPKAAPAAIPGQDYLNPPIDLTSGYAAVISIEPVPDNSPAPFVFKPLINMEIIDAGDHVDQMFTNNIASFPVGSATR